MVISNQRKYAQLNRDYKELKKISEAYDKYKLVLDNIESDKLILQREKDAELRDMAKENWKSWNRSN